MFITCLRLHYRNLTNFTRNTETENQIQLVREVVFLCISLAKNRKDPQDMVVILFLKESIAI